MKKVNRVHCAKSANELKLLLVFEKQRTKHVRTYTNPSFIRKVALYSQGGAKLRTIAFGTVTTGNVIVVIIPGLNFGFFCEKFIKLFGSY